MLESLSPELIVAQELCHVCAIDMPTLARDLGQLAVPPAVLSLSPHSLQDVLGDIETVGGRLWDAMRLHRSLQGHCGRVWRGLRSG